MVISFISPLKAFGTGGLTDPVPVGSWPGDLQLPAGLQAEALVSVVLLVC